MSNRVGIDLRTYLRTASSHARSAQASIIELLDMTAREELPHKVRIAMVRGLRVAMTRLKRAIECVEQSVDTFDDEVSSGRREGHGDQG